jgi:hypothetical protein
METFGIALAIIASALALGSPAPSQIAVPIFVEGGTGLDACASVGVVAGLKADGDNFLAVRAGPGTDHVLLDKLVNGDRVFICGEQGPWLGIVYSKTERDCGISSPWPQSRAYTGPCLSGWVHRNWIQLMAG